MNIIKIILELSFLFTLFNIMRQDFSERKISAFLLVLISVLSITLVLISRNFNFLLHQFLYNSFFILTQLLFLRLYFKIRHPEQKLLDENIGKGDILFLLAITPLLPFFPFIVYYICSLIIAIIYNILSKANTESKTNHTIPLAGIMAIPIPLAYYAANTNFLAEHFSILVSKL